MKESQQERNSKNIENTEDRQLRRSRGNSSSKAASAATPKPTTKVQKSPAKSLPSSRTKTSSKGGNLKNESSDPPTAKSTEKSDGKHSSAPGAGLVVDDMKEVDEHPNMERFLVSDTHYRTHKYLAALVRAMPCVSHEWIYKCLDEKKLVDYKPFLLPSGVSILDEKEYPLPTERGVLLRNKKVMVHSNVTPPSKKSMSFEQIWVPMVPQLGGEIVSDIPDEVGKLDILLTDHSATASMVEKARKIGCAVVLI
ncbi:hypothetical protein KIN20_006434 [Parelaphostrongylus tenuis]|uniref:BRCT domain-containing protein n=1 Tax=Parelaphostrongylus tenuis TaxID=148309 RepID=A0AAD5QL08_PARTN|nr:hypothetical protein KIN20_006434 [Parelaphostrongylus tenuis]